MAPQITDGVPGLEAVHTLTPSSPYSPFILNDWMNPSTGLVQIPHTRLQKIQGLNSKSDADDPRVKLNYQSGEWAFPRLPRGKTITYTGVAVGSTLSAMRNKLAALQACTESGLAGLSLQNAWSMVVAYNPTYDPSGLTFVGYGVPVGFTVDDEQGTPDLSPTAFQRGFILSFRLRDGRWFVTNQKQTAGYAGTGGAWSGITAGASGVLTMPGLRPAEPIFEFHGTGSGTAAFSVTSNELGLGLSWTMPSALVVGDVLMVDFNTRLITLTHSGVASDATGYITDLAANNFWWAETASGSLQVGTNTLTGAGDAWAVSAVPAV